MTTRMSLATVLVSLGFLAAGCAGADTENGEAEGAWTPSNNVSAKAVKDCTSCDANYARWQAGGEQWCMCSGASGQSATCPSGKVCLFENNDYLGARREYGGATTDNVGDFNDKASSWINATDRFVCFYTHINRQGPAISVAPNSRSASTSNFNDRLSSMLVTSAKGPTAPANVCGTTVAASAPAASGWVDMTSNVNACVDRAGVPCGWSPTNNNLGYTCGKRHPTWLVPWTCEK
jgi:hypothetical protein